MKEYLIEIRSNKGGIESVSINGDMPACPFSIAGNLWVYMTPWNAARRLELLAKSWEKRKHTVERIYGTIADMPVKGDRDNAARTINWWQN